MSKNFHNFFAKLSICSIQFRLARPSSSAGTPTTRSWNNSRPASSIYTSVGKKCRREISLSPHALVHSYIYMYIPYIQHIRSDPGSGGHSGLRVTALGRARFAARLLPPSRRRSGCARARARARGGRAGPCSVDTATARIYTHVYHVYIGLSLFCARHVNARKSPLLTIRALRGALVHLSNEARGFGDRLCWFLLAYLCFCFFVERLGFFGRAATEWRHSILFRTLNFCIQ